MDQIILERDQANAKVELLASILKDMEKDKIDADRISQFYDNAHTSPRQKTITQREINREEKEERRQQNPERKRAARRAARAVRSAARPRRPYGTAHKGARHATATA